MGTDDKVANNNTLTISEHLQKNYKIMHFIGLLWGWQKDMSTDFIDALMDFPKEVLNTYTLNTTMFRGMTVDLNEVRNRTICSWSKNYEVAKLIAETYIHPNTVIGSPTPVYNVIFLKQGTGIDVDKIALEMKNWLLNNTRYIEAMGFNVAKLIALFNEEEYEILSDFKLNEISVVYKELVS